MSKSVCDNIIFDDLFNRHSQVLRNYIYYKCGDEELADDIVQEAFIKLWDNCNKVKHENALFFLKRVATNLFLNVVKHKKVVFEYHKTVSSRSDIQNPEFLLEEKEFSIKLNNAIEMLPEKQREVFLMSRMDNKKYAEIADFLEISVKAVEKRMHLALVTLKEKIEHFK